MRDNPDTQRKRLTILRILEHAKTSLGASRLAEELSAHGISLSERMVRNYLDSLDKEGLTENLGRRGRTITEQGIKELSSATIIEKVGFVAARADTLAHQMSFDLAHKTGNLVVNISFFMADALLSALRDIERAFQARLGMGQYLAFAEQGELFAGQKVPEKHVAIATVCSITINGIFLKAGIPTSSVFGGLLELDSGRPVRFTQIIRYDGTTLDPLEIFIQGAMTSVRQAATTGRGWIGAGFREIPSSARPQALHLRDQLEEAGLNAIMLVGDPNLPVLDIPVSYGRTGLVVSAGLNPIAAMHERGIPTTSTAMSALLDWKEMIHYTQLRRRLQP